MFSKGTEREHRPETSYKILLWNYETIKFIENRLGKYIGASKYFKIPLPFISIQILQSTNKLWNKGALVKTGLSKYFSCNFCL